MSQRNHDAPPDWTGAPPKECTPPQPSMTHPPGCVDGPTLQRTTPRAISHPAQLGPPVAAREFPIGCKPPHPSRTYPPPPLGLSASVLAMSQPLHEGAPLSHGAPPNGWTPPHPSST